MERSPQARDPLAPRESRAAASLLGPASARAARPTAARPQGPRDRPTPANADAVLDDVLARDCAAAPARLEVDEVEALLRATGSARERLLRCAASLRDEGLVRAGRPGVITFSKKVFLPLTTMCRDRCHYCTFVKTPAQLAAQGEPLFMPPEQVLAVATQGAALGCKEALFTLGDRPEERWPEAQAWLDAHGYVSTLHYVREMAILVRERTGLLPHLNPGVMSANELAWLRPVAPSMGMMLETTSVDLWAEPGRAHYGSPDKEPAVRLRTIEDAGRARVPFTTGILVGIGETLRDRAESLIALRDAHLRHGHVQEVIVQNFRAKPQTAMRGEPDLDTAEYVTAIAVARLVLGRDMRIQVPPNLADQAEFEMLLGAGIDDWGGVSPLTADHVNPERPWPSIVTLADRTAQAGFALRERLTVYPPYLDRASEWIAPEVHAATRALADETGLARERVRPSGAREPGAPAPTEVAPEGTSGVAPGDAAPGPAAPGPAAPRATDDSLSAALERARAHPEAITDADLATLLRATGAELDEVVRLADLARRYTAGEVVTFVANLTIDPGALASDAELAASLDEIAGVAARAAARGATEICVQGRIPQAWPGDAYLDLARTIRAAAPGVHLHGMRPADIVDAAARLGATTVEVIDRMLQSGIDTFPGTGVKLLDEQHRRRVAPADLPVGAWVRTVQQAHRAGLASTAVVVYGMGESPQAYVRHLRSLCRIQADTAGFTELVVMPSPLPHVSLVAGRSLRDEHRAFHAIARLAVSGSLARVQTGWPRLGLEHATEMLRSGANDLGGLLLHEGPLTGGGSPHELSLDDVRGVGKRLRRPVRQRTTLYGPVADPAAGTDERSAS